MIVESVICPSDIEDKLAAKHGVTLWEVYQVLANQPRHRFVEKGHLEGEDLFAALGQTDGGRYLAVFFIYKPVVRSAVIISARDMSPKERRGYGRK